MDAVPPVLSESYDKNFSESDLDFLVTRCFGAKRVKAWVCDVSTQCHAASKAAASSQILFLVGDVLPLKNML